MKTSSFMFADLHCHPNLKTFGQSFSSPHKADPDKSNVWYSKKPSVFTKSLNIITGLTKFSQADFTTMSKANVKIAFVSLYPFEKGFFINGSLNGPISAHLANLVTSIGYKRVRHIQKHTDYFKDLFNEYTFLLNSCKRKEIDGKTYRWDFAKNWIEAEKLINGEGCIAVIPTIEGAHVFNTGLESYGRITDESEVLNNIRLLKNWEYPPFFITLAHNFNNNLCGHARSLDPLGPLVDQSKNLNTGFSKLGFKVVRSLLNNKPIYIDVKHMSLSSRTEYFNLIRDEYNNSIPVIVSHGAVTGLDRFGNQKSSIDASQLCNDDINFFDDELANIARTGGLFALQLDGNRLADRKVLKKSIFKINDPNSLKHSAFIIWQQLQHIAEVLDQHGMYAWGTTCIGSDYDGTINPLMGLWTSENLFSLAKELLILSAEYLKKRNRLTLVENKSITPEEIVSNFTFTNTTRFLTQFYI